MVGNTDKEFSFPPLVTDRYKIIRKIGYGGMGNVYLANDLQLTRDVAIKTISSKYLGDESVKKRIERECRLHAIVEVHPHIVALYDKISVDDQIFLILEYVDGKTLAELVAERKSKQKEFTLDEIITLGCQILDALEAIHCKGVIHRDIKPSNIIVGGVESERTVAKLMDFGIAKENFDNETFTQLTQIDSGGPGTPAYMAPERIDSKTFGEIGAAADLYAVGIILYEMARLEPPFHGTLTEIFSGHLNRELDVKNLSLLPRGLEKVLIKALKKEIKQRYNNAAIFAYDLKAETQQVGDETLLASALSVSPIQETMLATGYVSKESRKLALTNGGWKKILVGTCSLCLVGLVAAVIFSYYQDITVQSQKGSTLNINSSAELKTDIDSLEDEQLTLEGQMEQNSIDEASLSKQGEMIEKSELPLDLKSSLDDDGDKDGVKVDAVAEPGDLADSNEISVAVVEEDQESLLEKAQTNTAVNEDVDTLVEEVATQEESIPPFTGIPSAGVYLNPPFVPSADPENRALNAFTQAREKNSQDILGTGTGPLSIKPMGRKIMHGNSSQFQNSSRKVLQPRKKASDDLIIIETNR